MSSAAAQRTMDVASLVDDAKRTLTVDLKRIERAVRAARTDEPLPTAVFTAIAAARRDALAAFGRVFRLSGGEPARQEALTWLSRIAAALTTTYDALREKRVSPGTAAQTRRLARTRLDNVAQAFLDLDRALGCPYGCKGPK